MSTQFSGGTYVNTTFTGAVRSDIQANVKAQLVTAGWTNVALASGQGPGIVAPFTVTIASPGVVTMTAHGLLGGERVILQTTGALPTGLSVSTVYFVKYIDANTFNLSTTSGGSNINTSGSQSGTHKLNTESMLLESATQANVTNPIRVRVKDLSLTGIIFSVETQSGGAVGTSSNNQGGAISPGVGVTMGIIATKYHFILFVPGLSAGASFVMCGMLYVPSFLTGITDVGYMFSNVRSNAYVQNQGSFRDGIMITPVNGVNSAFQCIWNATIFELGDNWATGAGLPTPLITYGADLGSPKVNMCYRWVNSDILTSDVLVAWGNDASSEATIRGQFFDLLYIADNFTLDVTDTFDSHTWHNLTAPGQTAPRGGYWVATS